MTLFRFSLEVAKSVWNLINWWMIGVVLQNLVSWWIFSGVNSVATVTTTREVTLRKGTTGRLPCHVDGKVNAVSWSKGTNYLTAAKLVILDMLIGQRAGPDYYRGFYNISDDFSLVINEVQVANEGRYFCEMSDFDTDGLIFNETKVNIIGKVSYTTLRH